MDLGPLQCWREDFESQRLQQLAVLSQVADYMVDDVIFDSDWPDV